MSEFDSGDELFDGVDVDQLLATRQPPASAAKPALKRQHESEGNNHGNQLKRQRSHCGDLIARDAGQTITIDDDPFPDDGISDELYSNAADSSARMHVAQKLLTETFGYEAFRHEQAGAIGQILAGANALAVFPTGAGKSLCYQVCRHGRRGPSPHLSGL
jgi:superfamily II DNA helicase RecQ